MRLNALIEAQASTVFLNTDHFAERITHRPLGDDGHDASVVANVVWQPALEHSDGGEGTKIASGVDVAGDLAVDVTDQWVIGGNLYQTLAVGEPQGGLRSVTIQRTTIQRRTKARTVL